MKQRLGLAAALLQPRRLLVLDEPTNGLNPQGMREIRTLVRGWPPTVRPCSSPPISWTRSSRCAPTRRSWRRAGSSPRARWPTWRPERAAGWW
ncbi:hypothetical protein LT493_35730 [Streptomyces tricolor]|nr:hypothetical protein [Streptomyces tricolor]